MRPKRTLQSVTVNAIAAPVAGRTGVGTGGIRTHLKTTVGKMKDEPPPAATVWMRIIGARMRTPATRVSKLRSNSPS